VSSKRPSDLATLESDLPTTPEDVEALRFVRKVLLQRLDLGSVLVFLSRLSSETQALGSRRTHEGFEPFEL
jgi:hypothetical protein